MAPKTLKPGSPEAVRAEIEETRARMSGTLDEIEGALVNTKEQIRDTLDVGAKVRRRPLQAVGVVFGVGLLMGLITGGDRSASKKERKQRKELEERAAQWEERARRLLAISRAQEEEIDTLESSVVEAEARAHRAALRAQLRSERPTLLRSPAEKRSGRAVAKARSVREAAGARIGAFKEEASERAHRLAEDARRLRERLAR